METPTLKKLRTIVPGTLIIAGAIPFYTFWTGKPVSEIKGFDFLFVGATAVVAYALGAIYNLYCLRAVFNGKSHARITANIKRRLLSIRTRPLPPSRQEELLHSNDLMNVFYALVDTNETLKERAKLVRDNGLTWSSIADATVLGVVFASLHLTLWLTTGYEPFLYWGLVAASVAVVAGIFFHPRAERRHIELSNAQLDFIAHQMKNEAVQKVNAL
jgi:hypothetical protein